MSLTTEFSLFTCVLILQTVHASWWYLGLSSSAYHTTIDSANYRGKCFTLDVLDPKQREICGKSKNVLDIISTGASMGIEECQFQFSDRRWNCSTFNTTSVFGKVLNKKSRERAYIYAISAAGVMHAVTKACAKGELSICGCDQKISRKEPTDEFIWGGCSHNIKFGERFTREFVDAKENKYDEGSLMNLWNNGAGRRATKGNMKLLCKCHGVSGSCSVRICWKTMAGFREIGKSLKDRFDGAARVQFNSKKSKSVYLQLRPLDRRFKKPAKSDLVYVEESPDYCEFDNSTGSLGTAGRLCNKTSYGLDGCRLMCCGRGYHTMERLVQEDCNCKFFWCCRVECEKCTKRIEEHFCN